MNIDELKIVRAVFNGRNTARTDAVFQYDKGRWLVIEGLDLPASYQVHFSNSPSSPAKPIIGDSSGVRVPDDLLESGEPVYAWLYITDNIAGLTVKVIIIPVTARASTEDYTPTPEEQTAFDLAVAAINEATEAARSAVETVDGKIQDALTEAKESGEFDGPPGDDGISPVATVTQTETGATVTVTDRNGTTSAQLTHGPKGDKGDKPIKGTDYWTAADKQEIVDEAVQETEEDVTQLKSAFQELEAHTDTAEYKQSIADKVAGDFVQDVQVNGQSVVNNGVASIDLDKRVTVSGTTPTINALPGVSYVCGEVATIDIVTPETGIVDIVFVSGATPAVLTVTPPTGMAMRWANGFDPSSLEANTTYEINVKDGCLGVAASWT